MKRVVILLTICLLISLACSVPGVTIDLSGEPPTQPSIPIFSPVPLQPTATQPGQTTGLFPVAIAIAPVDRAVVNIYKPDGQFLGEVSTTGLEDPNSKRVHIAGAWTGEQPAVAYFTFGSGGQILLNNNGEVTPLVNTPNFAGLAGAPGQPILAYSVAEFSQTGLASRLYAAPISTLTFASPVLSSDDPNGRAIMPLAIHVEDSAPVGVWFARQPWGIGGDIVFEVTEGIYYVSLSDGAVTEKVGDFARSVNLSPDQTWAAYASGAPANGTFHVYNFESGETHGFDPLPSSDRGSGFGVFSPGNSRVAWMEGSGSGMAEVPNFHAVIRVGTTTGEWMVDYPDTLLTNLLGVTITWAEPVGWLDEQRLVIQMRSGNWDNVFIVVMDVNTNQPTRIEAGTFVGFVYP